MNFELLEQYEITTKNPGEIKDEIEAKLMEIDERLDNVDDDDRIAKLENDKKVLNGLLEEVKKVLEAPAPKQDEAKDKVANLVAIEEEVKKERNIPVAISEEERQEKTKQVVNEIKKESSKEKDDAKHEEELRKKAAELQKKQQAQKLKQEKQEQKENKENEKKEADDAIEKVFQSGLKAMNTRDFRTAFNEFNRILNPDKNTNTLTGKLSTEHEADAMYMLGEIYYKGLNGQVDAQRGIFWLGKAADLGHQLANIELGMYHAGKTPSDNKEQMDNLDTALDYFKAAADAGNADAMKKYVDLCACPKNVKILFAQKNNAKNYCKKLSEIESDGFVKNEMLKKRKELNKLPIRDKEQVILGIQRVLFIAGYLVELVGVIYAWSAFLCSSNNSLLKFEHFPRIKNLFDPYLFTTVTNSSKFSDMAYFVDLNILNSSVWFILAGALLTGFFGKGITKWITRLLQTSVLSLIGIGAVLSAIVVSYYGQMTANVDLGQAFIFLVVCAGLLMIYNIVVMGIGRKLSGE